MVNEAMEGHCACPGHCGRSTGARAVDETLRARVRQAMEPFAQRRIGKGQRLGDRVEALPCHAVADRLGATEAPGLLRPLHEGIEGGEGGLSKVPFEGPQDGGRQHTLRQKYKHPTAPHVVSLL